MLHAVIMAGGAGTRFWPASRAELPKQLLSLTGDRTMLQQTVDRLENLVPPEDLLVVTNQTLVQTIQRQLPQLPRQSLLGEPCKRDTAPCIGLAAVAVSRSDPDATLVVMPADHVIEPQAAFQAAVRAAVELVDDQPQRIVTFGIPPTYAAESFGYIERGESLERGAQVAAYHVSRFREKPSAERAAEFLASGKCYWNSGIFVWRASTILAALKAHQPEMLVRLERIGEAWGSSSFDEVFTREFAAIDAVSVDYAVMEHAQDVVVIEAPFVWDDLGSWEAVARLVGSDQQDNCLQGKHLAIDTHRSIVHADETHLVVTLGVDNLLIVHTPDATLVANRKDEEAIRKVVAHLREQGWEEYL